MKDSQFLVLCFVDEITRNCSKAVLLMSPCTLSCLFDSNCKLWQCVHKAIGHSGTYLAICGVCELLDLGECVACLVIHARNQTTGMPPSAIWYHHLDAQSLENATEIPSTYPQSQSSELNTWNSFNERSMHIILILILKIYLKVVQNLQTAHVPWPYTTSLHSFMQICAQKFGSLGSLICAWIKW